jgi:hypothetical protein
MAACIAEFQGPFQDAIKVLITSFCVACAFDTRWGRMLASLESVNFYLTQCHGEAGLATETVT